MIVYDITSFAADSPVTNGSLDASLSTVQVASLIVGVLLPILVGLVTKRVTSSGTKSLLLLLLSAVSGFLTEFINSTNFVWQQALVTTLVTFVIGVATYYGLWTPTGVAAKAQDAFSGTGDQRGETNVLTAALVACCGGVILSGLVIAVLRLTNTA